MEEGTDEPASAAGYVQNRTPSTGPGGGYLTGRRLKQETPKGDPAQPTHLTENACGPPHFYGRRD